MKTRQKQYYSIHKVKNPPASLSICQTTASLSESVGNLSFTYRQKMFPWKKTTYFICKTAFLELRHISTIRYSPSADATKLMLLHLYFPDVTVVDILSWLVSLSPWYSNSLKLCNLTCNHAPSGVYTTPMIRQLHSFPTKAHISYRTSSPVLTLSISLISYVQLCSPSWSSSAATSLLKFPLCNCKWGTNGGRAF